MKRLLVLLMLVSVVSIAGCELWATTDYEREHDPTEDTDTDEPVAPDWIEDWFYREFGDAADFPNLVEASDRDTVLAVAEWVDGFTREATGASYQYRTTGETVDAGGGDSSSMALLNFHACRENGIVDLSVELVEWENGTEEYICIWRESGEEWVIDADNLVREDTFLSGIGELAYGFDELDYWEYE